MGAGFSPTASEKPIINPNPRPLMTPALNWGDHWWFRFMVASTVTSISIMDHPLRQKARFHGSRRTATGEV
jgi:hypothetical protein